MKYMKENLETKFTIIYQPIFRLLMSIIRSLSKFDSVRLVFVYYERDKKTNYSSNQGLGFRKFWLPPRCHGP